ncbi:MAG: succinylglutamate desuccinylase/aspartoacylase family protein [bacterium]
MSEVIRYEDYLRELKSACKKSNYSFSVIDSVGGSRKIPFVMVRSKKWSVSKKTVCFSAGIHGNEIAASYAVLRAIEKDVFGKFKDIQVLIFPVANPTGFGIGRENFENYNLNRHFGSKRGRLENLLIEATILKARPFFIHTMHEDADEKKFYLYGFDKNRDKIYRKILNIFARKYPILKARKIYDEKADRGIIYDAHDGSLESWAHKNGAGLSMCSEVPGRLSWDERVLFHVRVMEEVLKSC